MRALSNADILSVWERGSRLHGLDQGLLVLSAAFPEAPSESLADWPLGRRNRALAALHCACFGPTLRGWLPCSRCGEKLEFEMDGRAIVGEAGEEGTIEPIVVVGHRFRVPTSRELALAAQASDAQTAEIRMLEACRLDAGARVDWSPGEQEAIGLKLAAADPMAETRLAFHCPSCGNDWHDTLEIAAFLWAEIEGRAKRLLWEVHAIAAAYGWTEKEILALSSARRALYFEMVQN
jgi:hypothetical protein